MKGIIVISLMVIVVVIFASIVLRFVFKNPMSGPEEICAVAVLWLFFAGAAYAVSLGFNIAGGIPVQKESIKHKMEVGYSFVGLVIVLIVGILAFHHSVWTFEHKPATTTLRIPYIYAMYGVLLGIVLMLGYLVREVITRFRVIAKRGKESES